MHYALEGDTNFSSRTHSGAKDFLLDRRRAGALFTADDFAIATGC